MDNKSRKEDVTLAKQYLMAMGMTESDSHSLLQQISMILAIPLGKISKMIIAYHEAK